MSFTLLNPIYQKSDCLIFNILYKTNNLIYKFELSNYRRSNIILKVKKNIIYLNYDNINIL